MKPVRNLNIAIYSPYLDTAGGGEKYMLTIAQVLSKECKVDILLDSHLASFGIENLKKRAEDLLGVDMQLVNFISAPVGAGSTIISRYLFTRQYDFLFYNSDGSLFFSGAKNNIVHFQMPFIASSNKGVLGILKLSQWPYAIYNSRFTQELMKKEWPIKGEVIYPPVDTHNFQQLKKKNYILSVGRFVEVKKHRVLIESFIEMVKNYNLSDWSLHLAGGAMVGDNSYIEELKTLAKGYEIFFYPNLPLTGLIKLYGESSIYWHGMGYLETDYKRMEHFGISTVEAMASGTVPVVINLGGLKEIVDEGKNGYLWNDTSQLISKTAQLINDKSLRDSLAKEGVNKSAYFDKEKFIEKIYNIIYGETERIE